MVLLLLVLIAVLPLLGIEIGGSQAGYTWKVVCQSTWLSLQLLAMGVVFTLAINSSAIALCALSQRWSEEISQALELFFQLISCIPLFVACLYLWRLGVRADLLWGGLILAIGDFLLAELFPLLKLKMDKLFHAAYREALRARGIYFPIPGKLWSWCHWRRFVRYYLVPFWWEIWPAIAAKIPLFFSAIIVIEKALFYGSNITGANRGLGSLFFDCISEWSAGKARLAVLIRLTLWCLFVVASLQAGCIAIKNIGQFWPNLTAVGAWLREIARKLWQTLPGSYGWPRLSRANVLLITGCFLPGMILILLLPPGAFDLYPWWLPITTLCAFAYIYSQRYFFGKSDYQLHIAVRSVFCCLDIALFLPFSFFLYVAASQVGCWQVPHFFEKKVMQSRQMIVIGNDLYAIAAHAEKSSRGNARLSPAHKYDNIRHGLLFQLRRLAKAAGDERALPALASLRRELQRDFPEAAALRQQWQQRLSKHLAALTSQIAANGNKKMRWQGRIITRQAQEALRQIALLPGPMPAPPPRQQPLPVPELFAGAGRALTLYWHHRGQWLRYSLALDRQIAGIPAQSYHQLRLTLPRADYSLQLHRYPRIGPVYIEEGIKQRQQLSIQPGTSNGPSWTESYRSFFKRLSLLGTVGGVRHQDIFLRIVSACRRNYFRWSVPVVILALLLLGSLPVFELAERVPRLFGKIVALIFSLIEHSTAIPLYVVIAIIFIGIYDGKNFTALFAIIGYFLLPGLYRHIRRQVDSYQNCFLGARRTLGMADTKIILDFVWRELRPIYLVYLLYFCATMVLCETSFAYLQGGAPAELSLGIFLYHSRHRWTTETYATIIALVTLIYMFCRFARHCRPEAP